MVNRFDRPNWSCGPKVGIGLDVHQNRTSPVHPRKVK